MVKQLELRMYGLVPYNISPIQQAIQFGHSVDTYSSNQILKLDAGYSMCPNYLQWIHTDKTYIILNGGTTGKQPSFDTGLPHGSMNQHLLTLKANNISFSCFYEPDLGGQLTAITFLVDERVFDTEKYPDFRNVIEKKYRKGEIAHTRKVFLTANSTINPTYQNIYQTDYNEWCNMLGTKENVFLREFLKPFKLA